ncbi:MAG: glycerophosphodiester phosphodiesterase family protein [Clostridium sp.]|nr:glycerophosphodiester phosphodiesterase family protein [Clostridium sp.]
MKYNFFKIKIKIIILICCIETYFHLDNKDIFHSRYNKNEINQNKNTYFNSNFNNIKIISHRGGYLYGPENSLKAIQYSIDHKVDYIEVDVQETKDGVVILMHDKNLKRLTRLNKTLIQLTYNEVKKLNISSSYWDKNETEKIPTLNEVVKKCNGKVKLIIEIKPYGNTIDLTNKVINIIKKNNFEKECMIQSMNYKTLVNIKKMKPGIMTGYIVYMPVKKLPSMDVDFYSIRRDIITKNLVSEIHKIDKKVYVWNIDTKFYMDDMIKLNVDGIITNNLDILNDKDNIMSSIK